jgi:hypothetical protein
MDPMTNSSRPDHPASRQPADHQSPERLRAQAIAALVPFFSDGSGSDEKTARLAAEGLLDDYQAGTPKELQLSTQVIALGWAAMACLRTAVAAKNLSIDDILGLQDNAIALDRSSQKVTKALQLRRKERTKHPHSMTLENTRWDEGVFQLTINQALEKLTDANAKLAAYMATLEQAAPAVLEQTTPVAPAAPAAAKSKLSFLFAEQMTPSVLSRRTRG